MTVKRFDGLGRVMGVTIPTLHCGSYSQWSGGVPETTFNYDGGGTVYERIAPGAL